MKQPISLSLALVSLFAVLAMLGFLVVSVHATYTEYHWAPSSSSDYNTSSGDGYLDYSGMSDMWDLNAGVASGKSGSAQIFIYINWDFTAVHNFDRVDLNFEIDPLTLDESGSDGQVTWTSYVYVYKKIDGDWVYQTSSEAWSRSSPHNDIHDVTQGVDYDFDSSSEYRVRLRVALTAGQSTGGYVDGEADFETPAQTGWLRFRHA